LPFAFINTDVARAAILCMLEEANKAEMVREKCPPYVINYYTLHRHHYQLLMQKEQYWRSSQDVLKKSYLPLH